MLSHLQLMYWDVHYLANWCFHHLVDWHIYYLVSIQKSHHPSSMTTAENLKSVGIHTGNLKFVIHNLKGQRYSERKHQNTHRVRKLTQIRNASLLQVTTVTHTWEPLAFTEMCATNSKFPTNILYWELSKIYSSNYMKPSWE